MKKSILIPIILLAIISILISGTAYSVEPQRDVIIGFHKIPGPSEQALIHSNGGAVKHNFHIIPAISASLPEQAIENMKKNPRIAYIEDDIVMTAQGDEYASSWGVSHIGSQIVHDDGINGTGIKIAIIDTGIDYTHDDLDDNYMGGYDFVFTDNDPFDDSYNGHGTHVAGIVAAEKNGIGVVGVAPNVSLYAVKVLAGSGNGDVSWIISGIEWAEDNNMDIAVMSLGGNIYSQALEEACDSASLSGVLLVASAGNTYGGDVTYPARFDSVIAVTATDQNDQIASLSAIGPEVELAAPGVDIYSTIGSRNIITDEKYLTLSGTSMAAPHVAGTAALIMAAGPLDINNDGFVDNTDVRLQLKMTAYGLGEPGRDTIYGFGLVNANAALIGSSTPEIIRFTVTRTAGSLADDAREWELQFPGSYRIIIQNNDLSKIKVEVYENGDIRPDLSSNYNFNKSNQRVTLDLDVADIMNIQFIPSGKPMTSAEIIFQYLGE